MDRRERLLTVLFSAACLLLGAAAAGPSLGQPAPAGSGSAPDMKAPPPFAPPLLTPAELFPDDSSAKGMPWSAVPYLVDRFGIFGPRPALAANTAPQTAESEQTGAEPAAGESESATSDADSETMEPESEAAEAESDSEVTQSEGGNAESDGDSPAAEPEAEPEPQPRPELSPELAALRDRVRRTVLFYYGQGFNVQSNTPSEVIHFCMAFGCDAEIRAASGSSKKVSGIGALCWNYPCAGYRLLASDGRRVVARVGYGGQDRPGEFLAMLAMAQVSPAYEVRVGDFSGTVADLVRSEQLHCQTGRDQSFVLFALAHYLPDGSSWQTDLGQAWSLERLVGEELDRPFNRDGAESVYRLIGLSAAVNRRKEPGRPLEGEFRRAAEYLGDFQDHALKLQNADGTWNPGFFAYRGASNDSLGVLQSTGLILQWLATSLEEDRLRDQRVVNAVAQVNALLVSQSSRKSLYLAGPSHVQTLMQAVRALMVYDERVFKPCDAVETESEVEEVALQRH